MDSEETEELIKIRKMTKFLFKNYRKITNLPRLLYRRTKSIVLFKCYNSYTKFVGFAWRNRDGWDLKEHKA